MRIVGNKRRSVRRENEQWRSNIVAYEKRRGVAAAAAPAWRNGEINSVIASAIPTGVMASTQNEESGNISREMAASSEMCRRHVWRKCNDAMAAEGRRASNNHELTGSNQRKRRGKHNNIQRGGSSETNNDLRRASVKQHQSRKQQRRRAR